MRNPLNRSLWREFKQNLARYLAIMVVMVLMISVVSGFLSVVYTSKDLLYKNQDECNVENGQFAVTQTLNKDTKDKIEDLNLSLYENFFSNFFISLPTVLHETISCVSKHSKGSRSISFNLYRQGQEKHTNRSIPSATSTIASLLTSSSQSIFLTYI